MNFNTLFLNAVHFVVEEDLLTQFLDALNAVYDNNDRVVQLLERVVSGAPYLLEHLIDLTIPNGANVELTQAQAELAMGLDNLRVDNYNSDAFTDGLLSDVSLDLDFHDSTFWLEEESSWDLDTLFSSPVDNIDWLEQESSWDLDKLFD